MSIIFAIVFDPETCRRATRPWARGRKAHVESLRPKGSLST